MTTPTVICKQCHVGYTVGTVCPICGDSGTEPHVARAILISIAFMATGVVGWALAPFYTRAVEQKGKASIVLMPVEIFVPGILPKLAALAGSVYLAIFLGHYFFGNSPLAYIAANYLVIDIPIRWVAVIVHLTKYLRRHSEQIKWQRRSRDLLKG